MSCGDGKKGIAGNHFKHECRIKRDIFVTWKRTFTITSASVLHRSKWHSLRNNQLPCLYSRTATATTKRAWKILAATSKVTLASECKTEHTESRLSSSRNRTAWFDDWKSGEQFETAHSAGINSLSKLRERTRRIVPFLWRTTVIDEPS